MNKAPGPKSKAKFVKVGATEKDVVSVEKMPRTKDTVAARNLNFPSETFTIPSKITIKVRGADDNLIAAEVIPIRGNCVRIIESLISIVREVAVCRTCQLRTLELFQTSTLSCATNLMFHCENCFAS